MSKAYLVLEDGTVFEGTSFGADKDGMGETVFTVGGMCGYLETLSDPAYYGQIVVQTFPLIGNYGAISEDLEGDMALAGYVVRDYCPTPSNFRCEGTLGDLLKAKGVPAIYGVDTRALTVHLRKYGSLKGKICKEIPGNLDEIKDFKIKGAVDAVTRKEATLYTAQGEKLFTAALIDCGVKKSLIKQFNKMGIELWVLPSSSSVDDIMSTGAKGLIISSGPGDPKENAKLIDTVKDLMGKLPMFGIGLGHQIMALAAGCDTVKMKNGHRGGGVSVKDLERGVCYITNQNHAYEVVGGTVKGATVTMVNLNDGGVEGLDYEATDAFSLQFYPEVFDAPGDGSFAFKRFIDYVRGV